MTDPEFQAKLAADGEALLRVSRELREFLAGAASLDPLGVSLLNDCRILERVGHWLSNVVAIKLPALFPTEFTAEREGKQ